MPSHDPDPARRAGRRLLILAALLAAAVAGCSGRLAEKPPQRVDLSGAWKLEDSLSDDPQALLRQQRGSPRGGMRRRVAREYLAQPRRLTIEQLPGELRLVEDSSSTRYVYGQQAVVSVGSGVAERHSGWKGDAFVVDYEVKDGPSATRTYEIDDGGRQLIVTTRVDSKRMPKLEFRTVYSRAITKGNAALAIPSMMEDLTSSRDAQRAAGS